MAYRHTLDKASQFASDNGEKDLAGQCDNVRAGNFRGIIGGIIGILGWKERGKIILGSLGDGIYVRRD